MMRDVRNSDLSKSMNDSKMGSVRRGVFKAFAQTGAAVISSFPNKIILLFLFNLVGNLKNLCKRFDSIFFIINWSVNF